DPYTFTQRSKAALIDNLALKFERKQIKLPRPDLWPEGIDELESFEYSITDAGSVRTSAPGGVHDDCVISLALAAWHRREESGPSLTFAWMRDDGELIIRDLREEDDDGASASSSAVSLPAIPSLSDQLNNAWYRDDDDDEGVNVWPGNGWPSGGDRN